MDRPKFYSIPGRSALIAWRIAKGRRPKDVAKEIGMALETYVRIESGVRRPPETKRRKIEEMTEGAVPVETWNLI